MGQLKHAPLRTPTLSPTIHRERGYRFSFYSWEGSEPPHVHVEKAGGYGKLWLSSEGDPGWDYCEGFSSSQKRRVESIVSKQREKFLEAWHEHFDKPSSGDRGRGDER